MLHSTYLEWLARRKYLIVGDAVVALLAGITIGSRDGPAFGVEGAVAFFVAIELFWAVPWYLARLALGRRTEPEDDLAQAPDLSERVRFLLGRVAGRLSESQLQTIDGLIASGEFESVLQTMTDLLAESHQTVTDDERAEILSTAQRLGVGDQVRRALTHCPPPTDR